MWFPFYKKTPDLHSLFPCRVHINHPEAQALITKHLKIYLNRVYDENPFYKRPSSFSDQTFNSASASGNYLTVLCIGTDRSTGDSLGPLIGSRLTAANLPGIKIYGTLDHPVHAVNLEETLNKISTEDPQTPVIAIDACLGKSESIGCISIKPGPLQPGTGVNKTLPEVGNFHIIGVVNVGGFMEYLVLQNTRLSLVMKMSELISNSLLHAVREFYRTPYSYPNSENNFTPVYGDGSQG
ncbi:MAG TPA: spore protease YyaC [Firmicutes bacterium]|nr:spore protease YyaC [Bacillota bacterium]